MSILDNNILEETNLFKKGFPKKDKYYRDPQIQDFQYNSDHFLIKQDPREYRYWIIDNKYIWKQYNIKTVIISVTLLGELQDPNHIHKIAIGISNKPIEKLIFGKDDIHQDNYNYNPDAKKEYNENKKEIPLYLRTWNVDWLHDEFAEWIPGLDSDKIYDMAYDLINLIKSKPIILNKIIENKSTEENRYSHRTLRLYDLLKIK